ncbi:hypothetical protein IMCC3317_11370 [Kordia antarctica]|uniref:Secretion system C-terminal sorting domain-containing protein n=1 Tax=Kordia antarctica TaxID=1218801 RepID=A0A7L4ZH80_9FLAO|nr:T9SS type A sorting domain-containing protein [Kordia antarctica]QHI35789.1 hypothetical protein IMCC3317_11370 [Kordia antarctica]
MKNIIKILTVNVNRWIYILFTFSTFAHSQCDGSIDTTFDGDGRQDINISSGDNFSNSLAVQSDGKILVGGYYFNNGRNIGYVARINSDGSIDTTFDGDGRQEIDISSGDNFSNSVAVQSGGKILVGGYYFNNGRNIGYVARINSDGSIDTTFDGDGRQDIDISSGDNFSNSVAVQSDDKILVGGYYFNNGRNIGYVARINSDGSIDTTFDGDGRQDINISSGDNFSNSVAVQSDGKILIGGYYFNNGQNIGYVTRINSDGSIDTTFDGDGRQDINISSGNNFSNSVAVQSDGKILVGGYFFNNGRNIGYVTRINSDGSIDTTFDGDGRQDINISSGDNFSNSLAVQSDGKILVGGYFFNNGRNIGYVTRINSDGSIDTTFDGDGRQDINISSGDNFSNSIAVQSDDKILVGGYYFNYGRNIGYVTRLGCSSILSLEYSTNLTIKLFPNPSKDYFQILGLNEIEKYKIYNINGSIIMTGYLFNNEKVNIKNYSNGIYFLKIGNKKILKLIKE